LALLGLRHARREASELDHGAPATWCAPIALGAAILELVLEAHDQARIFRAALFGLGTYALLGLGMSRERFRAGWPVALLLIATLPFGDLADSYLGFSARILSAEIVRWALIGCGWPALSTEGILVLENGAAEVGAPCSGLRSLWFGWLLWLAATWLERRRI